MLHAHDQTRKLALGPAPKVIVGAVSEDSHHYCKEDEVTEDSHHYCKEDWLKET